MKKSNPSACKKIFRAAGLALLLAAFLSGCVSGARKLETSPEDQAAALALAEGLYRRGAELKSFAARGAVSYAAGGQRHYFKFEAAMLKPDYLLFTALDPTGRPAVKMALSGRTIAGLWYGSGEYAEGPATPENLSRIIPLGLAPEELMALLTGAQARPASAAVRSASDKSIELLVTPAGQAADGGLWRLKIQGGLGQDPRNAVLESAVFGPANRPAMSLKYSSIRPTPREDRAGVLEPFPYAVEAQWSDGGRRSMRITYDEVRLDPALSRDLFKLSAPAGFSVIHLD